MANSSPSASNSFALGPETPAPTPAPESRNIGTVLIDKRQSKLPSKIPTKKSTRAGAPNYSNEDISAMLYIAEEEEPLGANHWAVVASRFGAWALENSRPQRDQDSLKNKLDKLSNMTKKTGDPSCPEPVRRSKLIARAIHNKCAAMTLGGSSDGEDVGVAATETSDGSDGSTDREKVGEPRKKRKTGGTGTGATSKAKVEQVLLDHIGAMSQHVGVISKNIGGQWSETLSKSDVVSIVKEELKESMKPTHQLLSNVNRMLDHLTSNEQNPARTVKQNFASPPLGAV